jgi:hypothetical protein
MHLDVRGRAEAEPEVADPRARDAAARRTLDAAGGHDLTLLWRRGAVQREKCLNSSIVTRAHVPRHALVCIAEVPTMASDGLII